VGVVLLRVWLVELARVGCRIWVVPVHPLWLLCCVGGYPEQVAIGFCCVGKDRDGGVQARIL